MNNYTLFFLLIPFFVLSQTQIGQTVYGEHIVYSGGDVYGEYLGGSVSFNEDATRFVAGGTGYNNVVGCAKVFELINGTWTQIGQTIEGIYDDSYPTGHVTFGYAVSMSADGNTIAVSAAGPSAEDRGYVRLYRYVNNSWTEIAYFGSDNGITQFGVSLNLNSDGSIIAIGAPENNPVGIQSGKTKVYWNHPGPWYQMGQSIFGEGIYNKSGFSVDLTSSGTMMAVSSPFYDYNNGSPGKVRFYQFQSGTWIEIGSLINSNAGEFAFGYSLDLSANGEFVAIRSLRDTDNAHTGRTQVYFNNSGVWEPYGNEITDQYYHLLGGSGKGSPIRISADGNILLVGIPYSDANGFSAGECRIYKKNLDNWEIIGNTFYGNSNQVNLGLGIDMSDDGNYIIIGSTRESDPVNGGAFEGAIRVYNIEEIIALDEVVDDILGNQNGVNITSEQLNAINGVSGAIEGVDYTTALQDGVFADPNNPTPEEIQAVIDQVNESLSLDEIELLSFKLFPNPAKDQFTIQSSANAVIKEVRVFTVLGEELITSKQQTVDATSLSSGMYLVSISTTTGQVVKKLIIE